MLPATALKQRPARRPRPPSHPSHSSHVSGLPPNQEAVTRLRRRSRSRQAPPNEYAVPRVAWPDWPDGSRRALNSYFKGFSERHCQARSPYGFPSFSSARTIQNQSSLSRSPTHERSDPRPSKLTQDACRHPLRRAAGEKGSSLYIRSSVNNWYAIRHVRRATIVIAVFACLPRSRW